MFYHPRAETGQGIVEFAILLMIIVLVIVIMLAFMSPTGCACMVNIINQL
jgi:hypothetical protein